MASRNGEAWMMCLSIRNARYLIILLIKTVSTPYCKHTGKCSNVIDLFHLQFFLRWHSYLRWILVAFYFSLHVVLHSLMIELAYTVILRKNWVQLGWHEACIPDRIGILDGNEKDHCVNSVFLESEQYLPQYRRNVKPLNATTLL